VVVRIAVVVRVVAAVRGAAAPLVDVAEVAAARVVINGAMLNLSRNSVGVLFSGRVGKFLNRVIR
jgi:hypothetical protein